MSGVESLSRSLGPVLDTYLNRAVGVTGCHSYGIGRPTCELDVIVVDDEPRRPASMKLEDKYVDLFFMSEAEVMQPANIEVAAALSHLMPVRDSSWVISTGSSTNRAVFNDTTKKCSEARLASALKALGRAGEAYAKRSLADADFWLATAGYDLGFAWLYTDGSIPAPSHVLQQVKANSKGAATRYEAWSGAIGLEQASRASCERRMDALSVLYDLLAVKGASPDREAPKREDTPYEILSAKAKGLLGAIQPVDCYAYLGHDAIATLRSLAGIGVGSHQGGDEPLFLSSLSKGREGLLSEHVVDALGFGRQERVVSKSMAQLKGALAAFAKNI